ncbi:MAG: pyridoxamine 5'-phosphate oxidase family protein [Eubacteriales bacterium]|nr:pyridoxamine 5'-phosphate oxidase family protein [Eubacteriales bacterium]
MQEVYDFLKSCGTYYLATCENGQPRVRPFGTVDIFEDKLYIQTGLSKEVAKQMLAHPKVEICGCQNGSWVRVAGEAVLDERREAKAHMLDQYPHLKNRYSADDPNTAVFYLKNVTATFSSFIAEPRVICF